MMTRVKHYPIPEEETRLYSNFYKDKDFVSCLQQCGLYIIHFKFVELYKGIPPLTLGHGPECDRVLRCVSVGS